MKPSQRQQYNAKVLGKGISTCNGLKQDEPEHQPTRPKGDFLLVQPRQCNNALSVSLLQHADVEESSGDSLLL